jgi:hypothetical protein
VEYDVGFHNQDLMIASALLAARTCHIFHLMVCLRENFQRACVDWETLSEVRVKENIFVDSKIASFCLIAFSPNNPSSDCFNAIFFRKFCDSGFLTSSQTIARWIFYRPI